MTPGAIPGPAVTGMTPKMHSRRRCQFSSIVVRPSLSPMTSRDPFRAMWPARSAGEVPRRLSGAGVPEADSPVGAGGGQEVSPVLVVVTASADTGPSWPVSG